MQGRDVKIVVIWDKYLKFEKILISREEQVPYLYDLLASYELDNK